MQSRNVYKLKSFESLREFVRCNREIGGGESSWKGARGEQRGERRAIVEELKDEFRSRHQ